LLKIKANPSRKPVGQQGRVCICPKWCARTRRTRLQKKERERWADFTAVLFLVIRRVWGVKQ